MKTFALAILGIALFLTSTYAGDNQQISVQQSVGRQGLFRRPTLNQSVVIGQPQVQQIVVRQPQQVRVVRRQYVQQIRVAQPQYVQQVRVIRQEVAQPQSQYVQQVRVIRQEIAQPQPQYVQQIRQEIAQPQPQYVMADPPPMQQESAYTQQVVTGQLGSCPAPQIQQEVAQPSCAPAQQLRVRPRY